jgi:hypothetical protein
MTWLIKLAAGFAALYLLVVLAAYLGQRRLLYFPDPRRTPPAAIGLAGVEETVLEAPDGARLIAWRARPRPGQPTLLYLHGNAGNLAMRADRMAHFQRRGYGVLMMAYRGYAGSTGSPSEAANVADARLAYQTLVAAGILPQDIVVYGESLGSGVAVQLAAAEPIGGLVLDAPFTSASDIGAAVYPYLPVRALMVDRYDSVARIGAVRAPLLVVHGEIDDVVPIGYGRRLFAAAPEPKEMATFPRAGHSDHTDHGSLDAIDRWIDRLMTRRAAVSR